MKRYIFILAAVRLLSAALSAGAASVTPSSASDYIFTTPLFPDSIRGEVMGDPPAYFDPRGEDIDWLFEAFMERHALINGRMWDPWTHTKPSFGEWPLSDTNNFFRWSTAVNASSATNIVVGYNLVTNAPRFWIGDQDVKQAYVAFGEEFFVNKLGYQTGQGFYRKYYLGDAPLLVAARVAHDRYDSPMFTNVNHSIGKTLQTVTNVSYIVMPMTNGTSSVFTNRWTASLAHLVTNSVTNVVASTPLDYCHTGNGAFPGFPNDLLTQRQYPGRLDGDLSIMYDVLRATVRLADYRSQTNILEYVYYSRIKSADKSGATINTYTATNTSSTLQYSIGGSSGYSYEWNQEKETYDLYYGFSVSMFQTLPGNAIVITRFKSDVVTTGGFHRVAIEAAFAWVEFTYTKNVDHAPPPHPDFKTEVYIANMVVVPLVSGATLDLDGPDALASVHLDMRDVANLAAAASGAPPPPLSNYEPPKNEAHYWNAELKGIVLIYTITPSTKFNDW